MIVINGRGARLIALEAVFTFLITLAILARIWSMRILRRALMVSDYLVFVAWAAAVAFNACIIWDCTNNFGAPFADLTPSQREVFEKTLWQASFSWTTATVLCKLSILFLCLPIFGTIKSFKVACIILITLCIAYEVAFIPVFVTECLPPSAAWTGKGKCRVIEQEELASVGANLVLDTAVVVLPQPYIWSLRMSILKKLGLTVTFSIGLTIVAILCWRLAVTVRLESGRLEEGYGTYLVGMQSTLEVSLGILAACIPTLAPLTTTIIVPAAKNLLTSIHTLRERLHPSQLDSTHKSDISSPDSGGDWSHDPWRAYDDLASIEAIPFSGLDRHQHISAVTSDNTRTAEIDKQLSNDPEGIHVFRDFDVHKEPARPRSTLEQSIAAPL